MKKLLFVVLLFACSCVYSQTKIIYVSKNGNNGNSGSAESSLANVQGALNRVQNLGKHNFEKIIIEIDDGEYYINDQLTIKPEMNGPKGTELILKARNPKKVILSSFTNIQLSAWNSISETTLKRIPSHLKDSIKAVNLSAIGLKNIKSFDDIFDGSGDLPYLFFDGKFMPLSKYPNKGTMVMEKVIVSGGGQEKPGSWEDFYANPESREKMVINPPRSGVFRYQKEHEQAHMRWIKSIELGNPVWLKGYWRVMWQNETVKIGGIDTTKREVRLSVPVTDGIGSKYHRPGGSGKESYSAINLLEEIDQPGEWCIDFRLQKLFFYPPKSLVGAKVGLAYNSNPVLQLKYVSNVTIEGVVVEGSLGNGIEIIGGAENKILGCDVRNIIGDGIMVDGGFHHEIHSCDIYDIGAGGIWLSGGMEDCSPRIAAGHRVINNHIYNFAKIKMVYAAGINCGFTGGGSGGHHPAVGMYVAHNLVHTTPHVGILHGSFDNVFEYNEVCDWSKISNDMGALYCYEQYQVHGNTTIRYNFLHSSKEGDGVYFDNHLQDAKVYGNILYHLGTKESGRGTPYLIKNYGLNTVSCFNNIVIDCKHGFFIRLNKESHFENNITVGVIEKPFEIIGDTDQASLLSKNASFNEDPGFIDVRAMNFGLKENNKIQEKLAGFKAIPFEKIGLFINEYRKEILYSHRNADYLMESDKSSSSVYEIEDRE